jgi:hypothetical protein
MEIDDAHLIELHDLKDLIIVYLKELQLTILELTRRWHATQQCDAMQQAQESTANFVYFFTNFPRFELSIKQKKKLNKGKCCILSRSSL